ncbi:hypothetical protein DENSPDRAFT_887146 [Dentipellis sp. KUC8613]|nr:hypothetical protein DENSPDRAFT_887146 [Dentipellis sp. KUC8613]
MHPTAAVTRPPPSHAPRALCCVHRRPLSRPPLPSLALLSHAGCRQVLSRPAPTVLRLTSPSCALLPPPRARGYCHAPAALFRPARAVSHSTLPSCAPPPLSHTRCPLVPHAPSVASTAAPVRALELCGPLSHALSRPAPAISRPTSPSCAAPLLSHARRPLGPRALSVASTATVTRRVAPSAAVSHPMLPLCTPPPPSHAPMPSVRIPTPPSRIP